jgi:DNA-binding MarR family transcriptional regulator
MASAPTTENDSQGGRAARERRNPDRAPVRPPSLDSGLLPELIGYHLRCAQVAAFQHLNAAFRDLDVTAPQFGTLLLIAANPGVSQSSVADALRFDRSTLVQIIDRLERRGLVVRELSPNDRRSNALRMTAAGLELLEELKGRAFEHEDFIARDLSAAERRTLIDLLERIHKRAVE